MLAQADYRPNSKDLFPRVTFSSPAKIVKGRLYDVVFTNTDPHPSKN